MTNTETCQTVIEQPTKDRADDVICNKPAVADVIVAFNRIKYLVTLCESHSIGHNRAAADRRQRLADANKNAAERRVGHSRSDSVAYSSKSTAPARQHKDRI